MIAAGGRTVMLHGGGGEIKFGQVYDSIHSALECENKYRYMWGKVRAD